MNISNINTGICHSRIQQGLPSFFVNWTQNGKNMYKFFNFRPMAETLKNRLIKKSKIK